MSPEDIAVLGYCSPKSGREEDCLKRAEELMQSTWAEDDGCICYYFYRRQDNSNEWVFHERWRDIDAIRAHVQRLQRVYGSEDPDHPLSGAIEPWGKFEFVGLMPVA